MEFLREPRIQLILSLLLVTLLTLWVFRRVMHRASQHLKRTAPSEDRHFAAELLHAVVAPVSFAAWFYALWLAARVALLSHWFAVDIPRAEAGLRHAALAGGCLGFLWLFYRATLVIDTRLRRIATRTSGRFDDVLLPLLGTALRVTVPIIAIFLVIRLWPLSPEAMSFTHQLVAIALIAAVTWVLRRAVILVDSAVLGPGGLAATTTLEQRALFTRVRMLRRVALVFIGLFAFAAVLMTFDQVRDIGRSILASAGIAGIVLGIAAQRSLGNLFAGIQIAMTQPIRLGDQVLVEGDVGNVEEITLTYVVVRVWDNRRIVLPISYFIERPFQNWTRVSSNMLSPLALRFDYTLPVDELRNYLKGEIEKSAFWDQKVFGVQVTGADDRSMEVRVLASAADAGASFNLQCELREKAIAYVRAHHPECLPRRRQEPVAFARTQPDGRDDPTHPLATQVARSPEHRA